MSRAFIFSWHQLLRRTLVQLDIYSTFLLQMEKVHEVRMRPLDSTNKIRGIQQNFGVLSVLNAAVQQCFTNL